jgi:hypothetical protein
MADGIYDIILVFYIELLPCYMEMLSDWAIDLF